MIPHFRSLTSLCLRDRDERVPGAWRFLQSERIRLRSVEALYVNEELLDYIASYAGLEVLLLYVELAESGADRFYQ